MGAVYSILRKLFVRRKPKMATGNETLMLNYALELAQEWGEFWLKPIQGRLSKAYPQLTAAELDHYNSIAQQAMKYGHDLTYSMAKSLTDDAGKATWRATYLAKFPWVDARNIGHLIGTGMYYAMKDGIDR
jgi:hypothetical protein